MTTKDDLIVSVATRLDMLSVELRAIAAAGTQDPPPPPPPPAAIKGVWTSAEELATRPTSGPAWEALVAASRQDTSAPNLSNQDDPTNVRVLAAALVFARTGGSALRDKVIAACTKAVGTESGARALALARELPAYVIAADLVGYREPRFVTWVAGVRHAPMTGGPASLIASHEERPNNWGTHAAAARAACAAYLGDQAELERCARVFRGWLGDRDAYSAFSYGDPAWQTPRSRSGSTRREPRRAVTRSTASSPTTSAARAGSSGRPRRRTTCGRRCKEPSCARRSSRAPGAPGTSPSSTRTARSYAP